MTSLAPSKPELRQPIRWFPRGSHFESQSIFDILYCLSVCHPFIRIFMFNLLRNWFYLLSFLLQLGLYNQPWTRDCRNRFRLFKRCVRLLEKVLAICVCFLVHFWRTSKPPLFVVSICFVVAFALWSTSGLDSCQVRAKRVRLTVLTTCLILTAPERSFGLVLSTKLSFGFIG